MAKAPLLAITSMDQLSEDIKGEIIERFAEKKSFTNIQRYLEQQGYSCSLAKIKRHCNSLPVQDVPKFRDLPTKVRNWLKEWFRNKGTILEARQYLAAQGYVSGPFRVDQYSAQILQDEMALELGGDLKEGAIPISRELEQRALTFVLNTTLEALTAADKRPKLETVSDYEKMANVVVKVVNTSIARRKLDLEESHSIERAREDIKRELRRLLAGHPELVAPMIDLVDQTAETAQDQLQ